MRRNPFLPGGGLVALDKRAARVWFGAAGTMLLIATVAARFDAFEPLAAAAGDWGQPRGAYTEYSVSDHYSTGDASRTQLRYRDDSLAAPVPTAVPPRPAAQGAVRPATPLPLIVAPTEFDAGAAWENDPSLISPAEFGRPDDGSAVQRAILAIQSGQPLLPMPEEARGTHEIEGLAAHDRDSFQPAPLVPASGFPVPPAPLLIVADEGVPIAEEAAPIVSSPAVESAHAPAEISPVHPAPAARAANSSVLVANRGHAPTPARPTAMYERQEELATPQPFGANGSFMQAIPVQDWDWIDLEAPTGCPECGSTRCVPGQYGCCSYPQGKTRAGRFFNGLYHSLCCPDPCYEGKWRPLADAAYFVEGARPVSQTRFRWELGLDMLSPDRAEYFWPQSNGQGLGPMPVAPAVVVQPVRYSDLTQYIETANGTFGMFFEYSYRSFDADGYGHSAGFGDMAAGVKTLLFDSELMLLAFQFRTYIPVGVGLQGLGTEHVSLEPSLIFGLALSPKMYAQLQVGEWIPIGGDPTYAGAVLRANASINRVLAEPLANVPIIGTLEVASWSFQAGSYTDSTGAAVSASGVTYVSAGPGLRMCICDKVDFGAGMLFAMTDERWAAQLFRVELRYRF